MQSKPKELEERQTQKNNKPKYDHLYFFEYKGEIYESTPDEECRIPFYSLNSTPKTTPTKKLPQQNHSNRPVNNLINPISEDDECHIHNHSLGSTPKTTPTKELPQQNHSNRPVNNPINPISGSGNNPNSVEDFEVKIEDQDHEYVSFTNPRPW